MANRLAQESSLYLRQHAGNPVDWYPWGPEALEAARAQDKPLLVSVGYSACHWCHVMAHESFESEYIARLMNRHFICIKVDREERPDVDQIYMDAVQMMSGHGGWPLNVFCLPDGRPFAGGTYFPPEDKGQGLIPWPQLLIRVADAYKRQKDDLLQNAEAIIGNIGALNQPGDGEGDALGGRELLDGARELIQSADMREGGFGRSPKFPPSSSLEFLLEVRRTAAAEEDAALCQGIDRAARTSLDCMARRGLFDQLGGGFMRYCVDSAWAIPHFEKMLYDNGLLLSLYARSARRYSDPLYEAAVRETVNWLEREMRLDDGLYAASLDADSGSGEGRYYVWTPAEITEVLGAERAKPFTETYGVTDAGNFEDGRTHLALGDEVSFAQRQELAEERRKLLEARRRRPAPGRDEKAVTAWNCLVARGLAEAAFTFGEPEWLRRAAALLDRLWECARSGDNRLYAITYAGKPTQPGFLDDYAFYAEAALAVSACVDWIEPRRSAIFQDRAETLLEAVDAHFSDDAKAGCFFTPADATGLPARKKDWFDNAMPSGNSALLHSWAGLHVLTGQASWQERIDRWRSAYPPILRRTAAAVPYALAAFTQNAAGIAVIHYTAKADLEKLRRELVRRPWRRLFLRPAAEDTFPERSGRYQLCVGTRCLAPMHESKAVAECV